MLLAVSITIHFISVGQIQKHYGMLQVVFTITFGAQIKLLALKIIFL